MLELSECTNQGREDTSFAKQLLNVKGNETKLLGLPWSKMRDSICNLPLKKLEEPMKRKALSNLAAVYDPPGLASPVSLQEKTIF